jgi:anti-anti-sigma regulatory factor
VVFSFFSKKPQPAPVKPAAKKVPAAPIPAREVPPALQPAPPPRNELESLDFTDSDGIEVHEDHEDHQDHQDNVHLQESSVTMHPVVEEVAILYANGQDKSALASLEAAVAGGNLGPEDQLAWGMLFDLCQIMGKREAFEQHAFDYSVRYEKSPPTWVQSQSEPAIPAPATGGQALVAFSGLLGAAAEKQIMQLEKAVAGGPVARVEFARVQDVDVAGAAMLLTLMKAVRKSKCELEMNSAEKFAALLRSKMEPGKREGEAIWLLLLEFYQRLGRQDEFEEWALQYAITFEVSPPSWENRPAPKKSAAVPVQAKAGESNAFPLAGEMCGAGAETFQALVDYSAAHEQVVIDCVNLKRMDFVSAGMFLNALTGFVAAGKSVQLRAPSHLLFGLFGVLGIDQVAQVERRKI